ncbi:MAG TPA: ATP-binding protein [Thermodesulfobacteriota bacterium]|nr:ATP-binding protein [Thermodesulfobacteriota bacterium]
MSSELNIRLRNDFGELTGLRERLREFCESLKLPRSCAFAVMLSLDELVTNIISYAWEDGLDHSIAISAKCGNGVMEIEVEDDGKPFNPLDYEPPDLSSPIEERHIGGLGIHLIQTYMDEIAYRREGGRNRVVMRKRVSQPLSG